MKFAIVTTCLNPGKWLLECISSVISQSGDFSIVYHIQDAGSNDGTLESLNDQYLEIERGNIAIQCHGLSFGFSSEPDRNMYDGINKGFRTVLDKHPDVDLMLWINSDDRLVSGSLSRVARFFVDHSSVNWLLGRTIHINESGNEIYNSYPHNFRGKDIASGKCDGIQLPYITQEACVWRKKLWIDCGELDSRLKFAGDYEYWRRISRFGYCLVSSDISIGAHRKHNNQLSASGCYRLEIEVLNKS